eukprot:CAMPEP_0170464008 /NCGR_PEP_ID=MMETSP0123-20130129/8896_1 /TAXON_ID=182087 /ORGANISM="Favella ehrenbergii, Strain Fehren 1" /LENGTH=45 /DNA_ID= /DNA_START= /DNA_END= /DNA_ORIENTATION=
MSDSVGAADGLGLRADELAALDDVVGGDTLVPAVVGIVSLENAPN